jgi:FAD/FMN-containing dehydrogenase
MISRRELLTGSAASLLSSQLSFASAEDSLIVNDIHSQLNRTRVSEILKPLTVAQLQRSILDLRRANKPLSVAGGRHAMGGQQFGTDMALIDMRGLDRILNFDSERGLVEVEAGVFWPSFTESYLKRQRGVSRQWGYAQKQTGADNISIGGTLAANAHGRGLSMQPFVSNIESFTLVDGEGQLVVCSRETNRELFSLAIGGYGLFGVVYSVTMRLVPRQKVQRVVEVRAVDGLMDAFAERIRSGFLYGDFQFAIDPASSDYLHKGVFSCYRPVDQATLMPAKEKSLSDESWRTLLYLAHDDKTKAFQSYADYYLSTNGQLYWSDTHQMSSYPVNYHREIDRREHVKYPATEMISEINVPRDELAEFLTEVAEDFRKNKVELIYGTVRLIEKENQSFLPWAKQSYACTIFNLHTVHTPEGIEHSAAAFRRLIDMAAKRRGTYYLTYHRYARKDQVLACYPNFVEFLSLKKKYDPRGRFQSDWYQHYQAMFKEEL